MVYSTCSFNPVENEAVVAELLRRAGGSLELLDVSKKMPQLVARPGRSKWRVGWRSKSKSTHKGHLFKGDTADDSSEKQDLHQWFDTYDSLSQDLRGSRVTRSMFPCDGAIAQELHKTLRLIPTDQNSGGFFIAVLRKVADLPGEDGRQEGLAPLEELQATPPADYVCKLCSNGGHFLKNCEQYLPDTEFAASNSSLKPQKKKRRTEESTDANKTSKKKTDKKRETLYRPVGDDVWQQLRDFYGLQDESLKERFWCRSDTAATVNYVDKEISDACLGGDALDVRAVQNVMLVAGMLADIDSLFFIQSDCHTGLKVFTKVTERGEIFYRPSEESLGFFDDFFTMRRLDIPIADFSNLLENAEQHVAFETLSSNLQKTMDGMSMGPAVVRVKEYEQVRMNIWVGKGSILPRVSKAMRGEVEDALKQCTEN
ncbi:hypothetical protein ON010_g16950 [Phytophthora cinnamomi]|nr:hypothetical protein ON010_g16950 [Phytophthora cinnamomi]